MKALVLAGGLPQAALIEELKSRGIVTILADYLPEPVAKAYADSFFQVSTLDVPAITELARNEKVDFLITVCTDQALLTVAQVSEKLGLPCYIDYQTARNVTNKSYMKQLFAEKGISTAKHVAMRSWDPGKTEALRYPLIVKPADCNSSKGVKRIDTPPELEEAFCSALALSRTHTVIVEEFIQGPELSVDVYVERGTAHVLAVSELDKIPERDKFVIFRSKSPRSLSDGQLSMIQQTAQQIADAFGLVNSPMLIQMIADKERVYVLEFSARTGGGEKYVMIPKISGFDPVKAVVDLTLGECPHVYHRGMPDKKFASEFIYCKTGVFDHMDGPEGLLEEGILCDFYCFKAAGTYFDGTAENSGDRVAGYSMIADSFPELEEKHNAAVSVLKVIDRNGVDMMRHDLLPPLY